MSSSILKQLPVLQADSGKRLHSAVVTRLRSHVQNQWLDPTPLVDPHQVANANWKLKLTKPLETLRDPRNRQARLKVMTLPTTTQDSVTRVLNNSLLGGDSYPILTAAAGIGLGFVSGGASLLFSVGTTALNLAVRSQRVLARSGDELWYVEEIGRSSGASDAHLECVRSYFLVDPFRKNAKQCGWLIHEDRKEIVAWPN